MKLKLNADLRGFKSGQTITVKDTGGIPLDPFWRARLKDSERDNCVSVVKSTRKSTSTKPATAKHGDKETG